MSMTCKRHIRYNCMDITCRRLREETNHSSSYRMNDDNAGQIGINTDGELTVGLGGGLTMDTDGDIGIQIAPGFSIDFD